MNYCIGDPVGPTDAQTASETAKMKAVKASLLSGTAALSFAVGEQKDDDTFPIG